MIESKHQTIFNKMLRSNPKVGHFELKVIKTKVIKENIFEPHQLQSLSALEEGHQVWKTSDADIRQKMCDTSCLPPMPAYVVFVFDGAYHSVRIGDVKDFIKEGITLQQAISMSEFIFK